MSNNRSPGRTGRPWRRLRAEVIAATTHCGICGQPLTDLAWPHPLSSVVDHIVPLSKGGAPLSRSNVRAVHHRCNAKRGDASRRPQRGRRRRW